MNNDTLRLKNSEYTILDNAVMDSIISSGDTDCALLYIYIARNPDVDFNKALADLSFDKSRLSRAVKQLQKNGALDGGFDISSQASPAVIKEARNQDPEFNSICSFYEKTSGDLLKQRELSALYDIYSRLNMPPSVIMTLITHLKETYKLSAATLETEACKWADNGIKTLEKADEYVSKQAQHKEQINKISKIFGISDRELSPTELNYIEDWLDAGFSEEDIAKAYDITIVNTHSLKWKYLNTVIFNLKKQGDTDNSSNGDDWSAAYDANLEEIRRATSNEY